MNDSTAAQHADAPSNLLIFRLNGRRIELANPDPSLLLVDYLRDIGLTGTKVGCGQGGCGACTVMVSQRDAGGAVVHRAVNSCLKPLCSLDASEVTTTEGIGNVHEGMDPAQHAIAACNGSQCGFCTPGFVMNAHALLRQKPDAVQQDLEDAFGGNLCRCTGYRPILHGVRTLASDYDPAADRTPKCQADPSFPIKRRSEPVPIALDGLAPRRLHFTGGGKHWHRPLTLAEVRSLKREFVERAGREQVKLVFGNTGSGIYANEKPTYLIDISAVPELAAVEERDDGLHVGAGVSIQRLMDLAEDVIRRRPAQQTVGLAELRRHLTFLAGHQVRSTGSIGGNIFMTRDHAGRGSPFPSDLYTVLGTLGASVAVSSDAYPDGSMSTPLMKLPAPAELPADAVITAFHIPFTGPREYVQTHRVARRLQMSHPIVNAGFRYLLDEAGLVRAATLVFGGLASLNRRADRTERAIEGKPLDAPTLAAALAVLRSEILQWTAHRHAVDEEGIRIGDVRRLAENLFYKTFLHVAASVDPANASPANASAAQHFDRPLSGGTQEYPDHPELHPLNRPIIKRAAFTQATGEVKYSQDVPLPPGGLHAVVVKSARPHARFTLTKLAGSVAALEELLRGRFAGFRALVTVADIPPGGCNLIGLGDDDPVFSDGLVTSVGAPIALAVAETRAGARAAAVFVERECIAYHDLPAVVTLDEAIAHDTAMPMIRKAADPDEDIQQRIPAMTRDGSDAAWLAEAAATLPDTVQVSGTLNTGEQAHFYLETFCALAVPGMYDQITITSSTQNPNGDQSQVARALGIKSNQVTVIVEQIGGGFGAKQHRAGVIGSQAAVAARKLNRPVRLLYERAEDMLMIGKRHPYRGDYRVAARADGAIDAMRLDFASDAGDTYDCSFAVMDLSLLQSDGCYAVPTLQAAGTVYRTNKTSNTAFRTFGTVQPVAVLEDAIEHLAHELGKKAGRRILPEEIRRKNLYRTGTSESCDITHFGQDLQFCNIRELWDSLYESSDFARRAAEVEAFNRDNRWRKRGIAMIPNKYGISFTEPRGSLNASSALVNVNMGDGSVVVTHGGVEMGQGLNTKIAQLAAHSLGIPLELIRVTGNNSDAIVNAPATAASTGYDLNGGAVDNACKALRGRLEQFCRDLEQFNPHNCVENWRADWSGKWREIVFKAWFNRVNLSAAELYKSPHYKGPTERNPRGKPFLYFVFSVAASEVEIDVLTGEFTILRTDVLYDAGKSPNPAVDIGQIEGGFIQGVGFATTEEIVFDHNGALATDNIWSYKPPCSKTIPLDFRIRLHAPDPERNAREALEEKHAVKSSKTAGEPPLTLGLSVYFAIKRAVMDARRQQTGKDDWFTMNLPATCLSIQRHCAVGADALTLK